MRKWLIVIALLALVILGVAFWLGQAAESAASDPQEIRIPIEDVL